MGVARNEKTSPAASLFSRQCTFRAPIHIKDYPKHIILIRSPYWYVGGQLFGIAIGLLLGCYRVAIGYQGRARNVVRSSHRRSRKTLKPTIWTQGTNTYKRLSKESNIHWVTLLVYGRSIIWNCYCIAIGLLLVVKEEQGISWEVLIEPVEKLSSQWYECWSYIARLAKKGQTYWKNWAQGNQ